MPMHEDPHDLYVFRQRRRWAEILRGFVVGLIVVGGSYFLLDALVWR